jgi:tRNA threonylcarbamoyl adenosine modification protein (Sua5/YciO/YrdC/YwlC family)
MVDVDDAVHALRAGEVIVVPTDTVYGLAALPGVAGATDRIFALKGRTADVPLAVLCADAAQAFALADAVPPAAGRLAERFWPGPLTLVLRRRAGLGYALGEPAGTIGLRCPDHALIHAITREVGPIAATSANLHGQPTPVTAPEVGAVFGDGVALVVDGGPAGGVASTVVDCTTDPPTVLRVGSLDEAAIMDAIR